MPNYFEEEYSTEFQNEESLDDMFGAEEEDNEETSQDIVRGFDTMTDAERQQAFGDLNFFDYLVELDEMLNNSRRFFFARNKRIVDAKQMGGIIDDLNITVPEEINRGSEIIASSEKIIADANAEASNTRSEAENYRNTLREQADDYYTTRIEEGNNEMDRIIEEAKRQAARLVSDHEITRAAREEGVKIVGEASNKAKSILAATDQQVSAYKQQVNQWAQNAMEAVARYCVDILNGSKKYCDDSIKDINGMMTQIGNEMQRIKREIGQLN